MLPADRTRYNTSRSATSTRHGLEDCGLAYTLQVKGIAPTLLMDRSGGSRSHASSVKSPANTALRKASSVV
ncbi:hypothetical protein ACFWFI_04490 [Streptomyces sp. NPDC060209]|uniref:hypothetical protein n=1 Tax=Streptomyces sp. NPDC060209 TaxID=3347073 RepID=UPI00365F832A